MRPYIIIFLVTANSLTSIILIVLGVTLFIFPESSTSLTLQSYPGIYLVFALLCVCEPIKWFVYKKISPFIHLKPIPFLIVYGVILIITSLFYRFYYLSLMGLLYITCYFLLTKVPYTTNLIIEKKVEGKALESDSLFHPLPDKKNHEQDMKK